MIDTLDIPAAMERAQLPGLAIGICDANEILETAAYGSTPHGPITPSTAFSVQSTSKLFTATLVLLAGLDLDRPITAYLPEFTVNTPFDEDPRELITLRHLLGHTAGFTHEAPLGSNYDVGNGDFDAHCRSIYETWLRFPVGHHFEYSNLGIDLAAYALQRATDTPFAEYARRALFTPHGLTRTTFDAAVYEADPDRAIGHWKPFAAAGRPLPVAVPMVAAGGLYTTVTDALRFIQLHLRGGFEEQYRTRYELGYGLGVYVDDWGGTRVLHHGGSGFGFQAQLCWAPERGLGAVILTNSFDQSLPSELARRLLAGDDPEPAAAPGDDRVPAALAGRYVGRLDDGVQIGDHLRVKVIDATTIELEGERLRFTDDATYMTSLRTGDTRYRDDPARTPPSTLDPKRVGTYLVRSWGVPTDHYRLEQDGDSPVIASSGSTLRLAPLGTDLYRSSTGEVLDLRAPTPTYANIPLEAT